METLLIEAIQKQGYTVTRGHAYDPAKEHGFIDSPTGITQSEMITLILEERQVEFAFEGKRFWDLRRHRLLESTFNNQRGTKVVISIKTGKTAPTAADLTGAIDDVYNNFFTVTLTPNAYMGGAYGYNSKYYFFAIPKAAVENNALLQQNIGWTNGTFDPLQ